MKDKLLVFLKCCLSLLAAATLWPTHGRAEVVLLNNGNILSGDVEYADGRYCISRGPGNVIRVRHEHVDHVSRNLRSAYAWQLERIVSNDLNGHARLARWCLRHGYINGAADRLLHISKVDPFHSSIANLEKRLKALANGQAQSSSNVNALGGKRPSKQPTPNNESQFHQISNDSMATFTRVIQPLLFNRCGQANCHGHTTRSDFRVLRPPRGVANRNLTWRNLRSVMAYVERDDYEKSILLLMAQSLHGRADKAPLEPHETKQYQSLRDWVESVSTVDDPPDMPLILRPINDLPDFGDPNWPGLRLQPTGAVDADPDAPATNDNALSSQKPKLGPTPPTINFAPRHVPARESLPIPGQRLLIREK